MVSEVGSFISSSLIIIDVNDNTVSFVPLCLQLRRAMCATPCVPLMAAGAQGQTSVCPVRTTEEEEHVCRTACS